MDLLRRYAFISSLEQFQTCILHSPLDKEKPSHLLLSCYQFLTKVGQISCFRHSTAGNWTISHLKRSILRHSQTRLDSNCWFVCRKAYQLIMVTACGWAALWHLAWDSIKGNSNKLCVEPPAPKQYVWVCLCSWLNICLFPRSVPDENLQDALNHRSGRKIFHLKPLLYYLFHFFFFKWDSHFWSDDLSDSHQYLVLFQLS